VPQLERLAITTNNEGHIQESIDPPRRACLGPPGTWPPPTPVPFWRALPRIPPTNESAVVREPVLNTVLHSLWNAVQVRDWLG